jgi:hypothetical protein
MQGTISVPGSQLPIQTTSPVIRGRRSKLRVFKENEVVFADLEIVNGKAVETNFRIIKQSDIAKCPHCIFVASHYRDDGSCKCDDATERAMMIAEWGYTPESFIGVPLRSTNG